MNTLEYEPEPSLEIRTMSSDMLNDNQRRHYFVLLSMLAQSMARLETLAAPRPSSGPSLVVYDDDLPSDFLERSEPHVRAVHQLLGQLAETLRVQPKRVSRRNSVRAVLVTEIVRIEDSLSKGLRGYGEVDPRVHSELDPMLQNVITELQRIRGALESRS